MSTFRSQPLLPAIEPVTSASQHPHPTTSHHEPTSSHILPTSTRDALCRSFPSQMRFVEGIGKLAGNTLRDHRGEDQKTRCKYARGYRIGES
ncbi:hypothetical protein GW17_00057110 [Ensete ventricosum]|nr:hypothetical protein GW17_00057110 [Ensete ventricosum]